MRENEEVRDMQKCLDPKKVEALFNGWEETMIYSYLQGCMGECYIDNIENPQSAQICIADFCFFAGIPNIEFVKNIQNDFVIVVSQNKEWANLIKQVYGQRATLRERYALKKENNIFNQAYLENLVTKLQPCFEIRMIDESLYHQILSSECVQLHDLCAQFESYEEYRMHGLGVAILKDHRIIAGASSYTYYRNGIEIEIDTVSKYRRQGLAQVCGAKLILECLKRNLYPSWDAHNKISLALAEKLGYHFAYAYPIYEIMK